MSALAELNERKAHDLQPTKKPRRIGEFARTLRLPDGPSGPRDGQPGDLWVPETEPTQAAFYAHHESGAWRKFTVVAPSQRGKTLKAILCPLLHACCESRQSFAIVLPNLDGLSKAWDGKLKPSIEGTGFKDWLPTQGPGSKGGRPTVLIMRDPETGRRAGPLFFLAMGTGGRETSVSQVSPQKIGIDEADDAADAGQLSLTAKRINSWGKAGRAYITSTVNDRAGRDATDINDPDSAHPILMLYRAGSQHRQRHRCPHCAGYFAPEYEHLDVDACAITCPLCAVVWSEADRIDALNRSLSVGALDLITFDHVLQGHYESDDYSELTTVLDYHMTVLSDICADIRAAKLAEARGEYSLMKTVMHKMFCRSYVEPAGIGEITNAGLAVVSARSDYEKRLVPSWVIRLSIGVDVQGDRIYWIVVGHGPDDRTCIVDWGYEMLVPKEEARQPTPADRRRVLHDLDSKVAVGWQHEGHENRLVPDHGMRGIDVGFATDEVVGWLRGMGTKWRAVRGVGRDTIKNFGKILDLPAEARAFVEARQPDGWPIPLINVLGDNVRRWIHQALLRDPYTPASMMLPRGLTKADALLLHLSGEVEIIGKDGKTILFERRVRHDWLDALIYAVAVARLRAGIQTMQQNRGMAGRKYGRIGSVGVKK